MHYEAETIFNLSLPMLAPYRVGASAKKTFSSCHPRTNVSYQKNFWKFNEFSISK